MRKHSLYACVEERQICLCVGQHIYFRVETHFNQKPLELPAQEVGRENHPTSLAAQLPWGQEMAENTMLHVKKLSSVPNLY